jgi:hypothetical protein
VDSTKGTVMVSRGGFYAAVTGLSPVVEISTGSSSSRHHGHSSSSRAAGGGSSSADVPVGDPVKNLADHFFVIAREKYPTINKQDPVYYKEGTPEHKLMVKIKTARKYMLQKPSGKAKAKTNEELFEYFKQKSRELFNVRRIQNGILESARLMIVLG